MRGTVVGVHPWTTAESPETIRAWSDMAQSPAIVYEVDGRQPPPEAGSHATVDRPDWIEVQRYEPTYRDDGVIW